MQGPEKILKDIAIDWNSIREELFRTERIPALEKDGSRHMVHVYAERAVAEAERLAGPALLWADKRITRRGEDFIETDGGFKITGKRLSAYLKGAHGLRFFLVTMGGSIEEAASRWMNGGEPLYGYLLDRAGSLAAEDAAAAAEETFRRECAGKGESISMRFSPGYCDWPVEEQRILDGILDFSKIGVRLTDSYMMAPKKSVSGVVGIGPKNIFSGSRSQCEICGDKECGYKR